MGSDGKLSKPLRVLKCRGQTNSAKQAPGVMDASDEKKRVAVSTHVRNQAYFRILGLGGGRITGMGSQNSRPYDDSYDL